MSFAVRIIGGDITSRRGSYDAVWWRRFGARSRRNTREKRVMPPHRDAQQRLRAAVREINVASRRPGVSIHDLTVRELRINLLVHLNYCNIIIAIVLTCVMNDSVVKFLLRSLLVRGYRVYVYSWDIHRFWHIDELIYLAI